MESVYLETSFIGYLVARPSRDLLVATHQQITHEWWEKRRSIFRCFVSQAVIDEVSAGDLAEAQKRLSIIAGLPALETTKAVDRLIDAIMSLGVLPADAIQDAAHIALSAVHQIDYLVTWNCRHLANAQIMPKIAIACEREDCSMPIICTPEELMGG